MRTKNRDSEEWIDPAREGKLGEGFLTDMTFAEQKTALRRCVKKWGYRSCLGSVMVLNRNKDMRKKYGKKINRAKDWLMKEYGRKGNPGDTVEAQDLIIFIDNTYSLYQQKQSIEANLAKKIVSGKYDHSLAPKLWMYLVDAGSKEYGKGYGKGHMYDRATRLLAAQEYADEFLENASYGIYDDYVESGVHAKRAKAGGGLSKMAQEIQKRQKNPCVRNDSYVWKQIDKKRKANPEGEFIYEVSEDDGFPEEVEEIYFDDLDDLENQVARLSNDRLDSSDLEGTVFERIKVNNKEDHVQYDLARYWRLHEGTEISDLVEFFEQWHKYLDLDEAQRRAYRYLVDDIGTDIGEVLENETYDDVIIFDGSAEEYAQELVDDIGFENLSNPQYYFDYEAFGRDLHIGGDLTQPLLEDAEMYEEEGDEEQAEDLRGQIEYLEGLSNEEMGRYYVEDVLGSLDELGKQTKERYIDYDALGRDMEAGGDIVEIDRDVYVVNPYDF